MSRIYSSLKPGLFFSAIVFIFSLFSKYCALQNCLIALLPLRFRHSSNCFRYRYNEPYSEITLGMIGIRAFLFQ